MAASPILRSRGQPQRGAYEFNDNLVFYNTGSGAADLDGVGFVLGSYLGSPLYGNFVCQFTSSFTCQLNYESGFGGSIHNIGTIGAPGDEFIPQRCNPAAGRFAALWQRSWRAWSAWLAQEAEESCRHRRMIAPQQIAARPGGISRASINDAR
jgi:hypothetical protein